MKTVCVDFGTSSLRAAVRDGSRISPLAIASGSPIDNASIPSAIYIPESGAEVCFGVDALSRGQSSSKAHLFELSPKFWLSPGEVDKVDHAAVRGLRFTRRDLICALLSMTVEESLKCAGIPYARSAPLELRISHPAWDKSNHQKLSTVYESIRRFVLMRRLPQVKPIMTFEEFLRWCAAPERGGVQVDEPVATALSVYKDVEDNARSVLLAVDIGAGTIDLGFFASVVPDENSSARRRLLQLTSPVSIFGAGDEIDRELLSVLTERGRLNAVQQTSARNQIRSIKENLFNAGKIAFAGVMVNLDEFTTRRTLTSMASNLRKQVTRLINSGSSSISGLASNTIHRLDQIHVVFAGGGANLGFLASAVERGVAESDLKLKLRSHVAETPAGFEVEASMARMAVAMGGAVDAGVWPITKWNEAVVRKGLTSIRKA